MAPLALRHLLNGLFDEHQHVMRFKERRPGLTSTSFPTASTGLALVGATLNALLPLLPDPVDAGLCEAVLDTTLAWSSLVAALARARAVGALSSEIR